MSYLNRQPAGLWWKIAERRLDGWRFSAVRADYYDYLSALLEGEQGARTLKEIFAVDARRYGPESVRGRLSSHWLKVYQYVGGDLYATWSGSFPQQELALVRTAQAFGNTALVSTLGQLSVALRTTRQTKTVLLSTLWAALIALLIVLLMLAAVPWFTVPRLLHTFSAVPADYHGHLTRSIIQFAAFIQNYAAFIAVFLMGGSALMIWSLANAAGRLRLWLDSYSLWRLYRYVQALHFLTFLTILLGRDSTGTVQLRYALSLQQAGASKWLAAHIGIMLAHIDAGTAGAETFDSGLLDRQQFWFLTDMVAARGLSAGLMLAAERLRTHFLVSVSAQALIMRWALLLGCVTCLLGLGLWHYAVIDELRRSLMLFYASQ